MANPEIDNYVPDEITALRAEVERLKAEKDELQVRLNLANDRSLEESACHAIRELLKANDVPVAAFIDDHVGNAIVQRNEAVTRAAALEAEKAKLVAVVEAARKCQADGWGDMTEIAEKLAALDSGATREGGK